MCRTYRYRLHPTFRQQNALERQLECQRELYNAALEERIGAWKWEKRSVTYVDQCRTLTTLVEVRPDVVASGVVLCRGTLKRLDRAFTSFFRRVQQGSKPGYPRFKAGNRFNSLMWSDDNGWKIKMSGRRLHIMGIGDIRANYHRGLKGTPKTITVRREGKKWWLNVSCMGVPAEPLPLTGLEVGVDLGVTNLVATSDGQIFRGDRFAQHAQGRLIAAQQKLFRQVCGSKRRGRQAESYARLHRKVANQRINAAHQLSRRLVNEYDFIVLEDLRISSMLKRPKPRPSPEDSGRFLPNGARANAGLNRSISDAGWAILRSHISYKAESAGRSMVTVDPRHTSQTCAECGHVESGNRVNQAVFRCLGCGHTDRADVNAARNILRAGRARQASACVGLA
jgi:putative transposase